MSQTFGHGIPVVSKEGKRFLSAHANNFAGDSFEQVAISSGLGAGLAEEVAGEGEEAGEFIGGIDVAFEDIKREVVEAAEGPHGEKQQGGDAKGWPLEKQQDRREHT